MTFAQIMDFAIMALLAATVFIGFRLFFSLRRFHESRAEMEGLLVRLTSNIEHAERAMGGLQNTTKNSGVQLQAIINDSKFLIDELKFMNEAGNNLADRLEKLAEKNNDKAQTAAATIHYHAPAKTVKTDMNEEPDVGGFMIQDRDFDDEAFDVYAALSDEEGDAVPSLQSQAERELFEALSRNKRKVAGRA